MKPITPSVALKAKQQVKPSIKEIILKYIIYLPIIIISVTIATAGAYIYLQYQVPVYASTISVYFPDMAKGGAQGADVSALSEVLLFDQKVNLVNEIQVIKSKSLMQRVVEKLHLNERTYIKGKAKTTELYRSPYIQATVLSVKDSSQGEYIEIVKLGKQLFRVVGDQKTAIASEGKIQGTNVTYAYKVDPLVLKEEDKYLLVWEPISQTASVLSWTLGVYHTDKTANILSFIIHTEVPAKGIDLLNTLVVEYNIRSNEQKNRLVDYTLQFIDERVELMRGELGKVETGLQRMQESEVITPNATSGIGLGEMATGKDKIVESEMKLEVINMVRQSVTKPNQLIPTLGLDDPTISGLVGQYNSAIMEREELLRTMPAANPIVRNAQASLEKYRANISSALDNVAVRTKQLKQRAYGDVSAGRSKLVSVPRQERQLLEISRQQDIKEKLFLFLLQRKEEAAITKASNLSSNTIPIDPAVTTGVVKPIAGAIYQKAILFALFIPLGLIYLRELLNDKVTTRQDISSKTNTPIMGEILHNADKKRRLVVAFDDRSVLGEQFRMVRANMTFLTKNRDKKVVLVTSTTSGEGKTFCSLNLGAVYAIAGKKTVILEMDLRKPKVTESLNIPNTLKGITHYVSEQAELEELPIPVPEHQNLFVITAGIIPPNPSEILMDERIDQLFAYLRIHFDCIIIDSAPLGLVSDAKVLAKQADSTVYIVRQRVTAKKQIHAINELYEKEEFPNFSIMVNDVKARGSASYYGYGGNYMSNYKVSYGNEEKTMWQKAKTLVGLNKN